MKRIKCEECGGKIVKKKKDYISLGENLGKFEAEVCSKCGEQVFDEDVTKRISMIAKKKGLYGLAAKSKINQVGNSIAVTIASKIAKFANLKKDEEVRVYLENKHRLIVETSGWSE